MAPMTGSSPSASPRACGDSIHLQSLPGFEVQLLLDRLPDVLGQPELRRMGINVARGLAERGVVRLLRDVLMTPTATQAVVYAQP